MNERDNGQDNGPSPSPAPEPAPATDFFQQLRELTPERIRARLAEIDREAQTLRALLRSARARSAASKRQHANKESTL